MEKIFQFPTEYEYTNSMFLHHSYNRNSYCTPIPYYTYVPGIFTARPVRKLLTLLTFELEYNFQLRLHKMCVVRSATLLVPCVYNCIFCNVHCTLVCL